MAVCVKSSTFSSVFQIFIANSFDFFKYASRISFNCLCTKSPNLLKLAINSSGKSCGRGLIFLATLFAKSPIRSKSLEIFNVDMVSLKSIAIGALFTSTLTICSSIVALNSLILASFLIIFSAASLSTLMIASIESESCVSTKLPILIKLSFKF